MAEPVTPARKLRRRRKLSTVFGEMHYRLRTEGDSPLRTALAVGLGTWIGVVPVYGLHLPLCVVTARLLGLSRVTTYLAAHINNPFTAPLWIYLSYGVGSWFVDGAWPRIDRASLETLTVWTVGRALLLGGLLVGAVAGLILGGSAYVIGRRDHAEAPVKRLWLAVAYRYLAAGVWNWEFVLGKLRRDPIYRTLFRDGLLPSRGHLLDLGCGRGIVAALLAGATEAYATGHWPPGWAPPPAALSVTGVELRRRVAAVARRVLKGLATIERASLADYHPPPADGVLLLDVLHYLDRETQDLVLERACRALRPGGVLLIREADAAAGGRFTLTRIAERGATILRGHPRQRFVYRSIGEWCAALEAHGLSVTTRPMSEGTPFGNSLIVGRVG